LEIHARSPSPPPVYDGKTGKRLNTREQRYKDKLEKELAQLIEKAKEINPRFQPPANFKPKTLKKTKKIYLPVKQFPDYNFIGLILGKYFPTQFSCTIFMTEFFSNQLL
jgi:splicing factor 1